MKIKAIVLIFRRYEVIFPEIYNEVTGETYADAESAHARMRHIYKELLSMDSSEYSEYKGKRAGDFYQKFYVRKRLISVLLIVIISRTISIKEAERVVQTEDGFLFDYMHLMQGLPVFSSVIYK